MDGCSALCPLKNTGAVVEQPDQPAAAVADVIGDRHIHCDGSSICVKWMPWACLRRVASHKCLNERQRATAAATALQIKLTASTENRIDGFTANEINQLFSAEVELLIFSAIDSVALKPCSRFHGRAKSFAACGR